MMSHDSPPVVILGAGPVGLGAALELARHRHAPPGWKSPIRFLATATGTEFGVIESKGFEGPGPGLQDRGGSARAYGLENDGAVLVRPDGHVAWRSARGPATAAALRAALGRILGR